MTEPTASIWNAVSSSAVSSCHAIFPAGSYLAFEGLPRL
jgi:hypothetical protein